MGEDSDRLLGIDGGDLPGVIDELLDGRILAVTDAAVSRCLESVGGLEK
jgi:hypothetical protein